MFNIRRLMAFLQLGYILFNLQGAVFNTLAGAGVIKGNLVLRPEELASSKWLDLITFYLFCYFFSMELLSIDFRVIFAVTNCFQSTSSRCMWYL